MTVREVRLTFASSLFLFFVFLFIFSLANIECSCTTYLRFHMECDFDTLRPCFCHLSSGTYELRHWNWECNATIIWLVTDTHRGTNRPINPSRPINASTLIEAISHHVEVQVNDINEEFFAKCVLYGTFFIRFWFDQLFDSHFIFCANLWPISVPPVLGGVRLSRLAPESHWQ